MTDDPTNLRLLVYAIYCGGGSAVISLLLAAYEPWGFSAPAVWLTASGVLALASGVAAFPVLRAWDRRKRHG